MRDTRVYVHTLWRLLTDPVLPLDFAAHARVLLEELGSAAFVARRALFGRRADRRGEDAARQGVGRWAQRCGADARVACAGAGLLHVSGDRFAHDPALPLPAWPVLDPLRKLAKVAPGTDSAHFLAVSATRGRNRLAYALREAAEALAG